MRGWLDRTSRGEAALDLVLGGAFWMGTSLWTFGLLVTL